MAENQEREVLGMISFEWDPVRAREVALEEGREIGRAEARAEARAEILEENRKKTNRFVLSLLKNKAPMHFITDATDLSVEEVEKIAREHQLTI